MPKRAGLIFLPLTLLLGPGRLGYTALVANVYLGGTSQNKSAIYNANDTVSFTVTVTTADVPNDATAKVDFLDFSNPGNVGYTVSSRTQTKTLTGGGQGTNFTFSVTTNGDNTNTGTVTLQFRLDSATDATVVDPKTASVSVTVQRAGGGSGGGGSEGGGAVPSGL